MKREVVWYHVAVEQILMLSARNTRQATRLMLALRDFGNGSRGDLKKLKGTNDWRLRTGDWRIFLKLDGELAGVFGLSDRQDAYN